MKKTLKTLLVLFVALTVSNCNNDDPAAPNVAVCNYSGLTALLNSTRTLIPESDLTSEYFTATSNGPEIEIYQTSNPGNFNFTTTVVNENTTGTGTITYGGNTYSNLTIKCQRGVTGTTGANVGDSFRFDITNGSGLEIEMCVSVHGVTLGYIDQDGDGCGSQTVSYGFGVLNNLDTDDTNPNACL